jgi:HEAT repeat protein
MSESLGVTSLLPRALKEINTAMKAIAFYPSSHPSVVTSLERAASTLQQALPGEEQGIKVGVADAAFLFGGEILSKDDHALASFATYLSRRGVGALVFRTPLERDALRGLLEVVALDPATLRALGGPTRCLSGKGVRGVGVEEFDPASLLKSVRTSAPSVEAGTGGSPGSWSDLVVRFLLGQAGPPGGGTSLLRRVAGDAKAARELMASLKTATQALGKDRGPLLTQALSKTAAEVASVEPEALASLAVNLTNALGELDAAGQIEILQASIPVPGGSLDLAREIRSHLPDERVGELIVSLVRSEGKVTRRLASVVRKVLIDAPDPERRQEQLQGSLQAARRPGEEAMADVWESVESLLEESEDTWISREYKGFLELIGAEPLQLDEATRKELEALPGFMEALSEAGIRRRVWTLFADLLELEREPARIWVALDQIEKRCPAIEPAWFADCGLVAAAIRSILEARPAPESFVREAADKALRALAAGTIVCFRRKFHELDEAQRRSFSAMFAALGPHSLEPLLAGLQQEEDWEVRRNFIPILVSRGREAVPMLLRRLADPSWYLVRNILVILGEIGDPSTVPAISQKLKHPEPRVRRDAVAALGRIGGAKAFALVSDCLADPDVAEVAMRCLAAIDRERTVATFLERTRRLDLLGRHRGRVREAIAALGSLGAHESVGRLQEILMRGLWLPPSAGDAVRIAAARALQQIGTVEALRALEGGRRLWRASVRDVCRELVGRPAGAQETQS